LNTRSMCTSNLLQKIALEMFENKVTDEQTKVRAIDLVKECITNKLDLPTNHSKMSQMRKHD
jgi:hypothetical protein